jgi:hypothetical protein
MTSSDIQIWRRQAAGRSLALNDAAAYAEGDGPFVEAEGQAIHMCFALGLAVQGVGQAGQDGGQVT